MKGSNGHGVCANETAEYSGLTQQDLSSGGCTTGVFPVQATIAREMQMNKRQQPSPVTWGSDLPLTCTRIGEAPRYMPDNEANTPTQTLPETGAHGFQHETKQETDA